MKNIEAIIIKTIGVAVSVTSSMDFFGLLPLPKMASVPAIWQLSLAFACGIGLIVTPLKSLQSWYEKAVNKKIDKI